MKKSIRFILVILALIALILPITYSYATEKIGGNANEKSFFEISELEVAKSEKIEMTINLDEIKYNQFLFELESNENIENVEVDNEKTVNNSGSLEVEKSSNEIVIEIDKKITNLSTITLYYQIPETVQVNDTIKFVATVTNMESDEKEDLETETQTEPETQTVEVEVKIVEKEEQNTNQPENENQGTESNQQNNAGKLPEQNSGNQSNTMSSTNMQTTGNNKTSTNMQMTGNNATSTNNQTAGNNTTSTNKQIAGTSTTTSTSSQKTEETVTYNGSDNNYLSELSVSGYTLNKEFSKDNSTYFITVENDVESLDITATEEDETAIVCVYGNEDLSEGTNKILISVTAENGNVRNYRIYVTKNS